MTTTRCPPRRSARTTAAPPPDRPAPGARRRAGVHARPAPARGGARPRQVQPQVLRGAQAPPAPVTSRHHRSTSCSSLVPGRPVADAGLRAGERRPAGRVRAPQAGRWLCGPRPCRLTATSRRRAPGRAGPARPGRPPAAPCRPRRAPAAAGRPAPAPPAPAGVRATPGGARAAPAPPVSRSPSPSARSATTYEPRAHGQDVSVDAVTTSSRTSQPTGWRSAISTACGDVGRVVELRVRAGAVLLGPVVEERGAHAAGDEQRDADLAGQLRRERPGEARRRRTSTRSRPWRRRRPRGRGWRRR